MASGRGGVSNICCYFKENVEVSLPGAGSPSSSFLFKTLARLWAIQRGSVWKQNGLGRKRQEN